MPAPCPLCRAPRSTLHHKGTDRSFWHCRGCDLVFVAPQERLSYDAEVARYKLHRNVDDDPKYIAFLSRLADQVIARTPVGARGLDYGCGPSTALAQIFTRAGRPTESYDPAFRPDAAVLEGNYDFLTCSEVVEHLHEPFELLERFGALVRPGGVIGIMTTFRDPAVPFGEWWYQRDPTHVCFYSEASMRWIARSLGWRVELPAASVGLFSTVEAG